jgi:peptidoglycan/LPS O-acetylase OafA/YrhL
MGGRQNNFDVLRLGAALLVLWSHSYAVTATPKDEPFLSYFGFTLSGGMVAVDAFFFISGYWISQSAESRPLFQYAKARALRILPALFVAVLFGIAIGAYFTTLPRDVYFSSPVTWDYLRNAYVFGIRYELPGVFETLPYSAVNGSLWTLPVEVTMYYIAAVIAGTRMRSPTAFAVAVAVWGVTFFFAHHYFGLGWSNRGPHIPPSVPLFNLLWSGFFFMAGAAFAKFRPEPSMRVCMVAIAAIVASGPFVIGQAVYFVALPLAIYHIAFARWTVAVPFGIDASYGAYLYAFPVQQGVVQLLGTEIGPTAVTLIALPITLALAFCSAVLIERPFLRLKASRKSKPIAASLRSSQPG